MKTLALTTALALAAITAAHAQPLDLSPPARVAAPIATPFTFANPGMGGVATLETYHAACGQTVPPPVIKIVTIVTRTFTPAERKAYGDAAVEVWRQKQRLGTDGFCAVLRPVLEPLLPGLLAAAIETGLGF
jgi:hypothetical protein